VFDSGGFRVTPYFVTKVVDGDGHVLEEYTPPPLPVFSTMSSAGVDGPGLTAQEGQPPVTDMSGNPVGAIPPATQAEQSQAGQSTDTDLFRGPARVISPATAYIITNLMESVVNSGTGQRARALGRPVAGKTGTTNDMKDAWFVGYVPQLVAGVWVGYDHEKSLGAGGSGGSAAAPIWTEFMKRALAGTPVQTFQPPPDVTFAVINPKTGLLARPGSADSVRECFIAGTEPKSYDVETPVPPFGDIQQPVVITK
jgi:penicillin-binding protein 1A